MKGKQTQTLKILYPENKTLASALFNDVFAEVYLASNSITLFRTLLQNIVIGSVVFEENSNSTSSQKYIRPVENHHKNLSHMQALHWQKRLLWGARRIFHRS